MVDFFHLIFAHIFWQPLYNVAIAIVMLPLLWGTLALLSEAASGRHVTTAAQGSEADIWHRFKCGKSLCLRGFQFLNLFLFICSVFSVFSMTILGRSAAVRAVYLIPFHFLSRSLIYPLIYRSMLLNILLFVPLGMTLSFLLPERVRHWVCVTLGLSCGLSALVEIIQYAYNLGYCDVDDVMMNTLGALVGCLARWIFMNCERKTVGSPTGNGSSAEENEKSQA